ncbi:MAG: hypothetical protein JKY09_03365 [Crocinitomicaceae bacterium]|nr:hypothetical protein [Crocinitomicaceae bacterium]
MKKIIVLLIIGAVFHSTSVYCQEDNELEEEYEYEYEESEETFNSTRIINGHTVETLYKGYLEFRIEHRFGDIAGSNGGSQTLYGFDNVADMRFGFEYGVTDKFMIGIGRSKGTNAPYRALFDGFMKYRLLTQKKGKMPLSMAVLGTSSYTYMNSISDENALTYFPKLSHRLAYASQLNIARKFGKRLSLAVMPTVVHRNYVNYDDINTLFSLGGGARFALSTTFALVVEYYHNFHGDQVRTLNTNSLGVAIEWITFGHSFTINLTNSKGFGETQFIPYTYEFWQKGQFRLGFCISRTFVKE